MGLNWQLKGQVPVQSQDFNIIPIHHCRQLHPCYNMQTAIWADNTKWVHFLLHPDPGLSVTPSKEVPAQQDTSLGVWGSPWLQGGSGKQSQEGEERSHERVLCIMELLSPIAHFSRRVSEVSALIVIWISSGSQAAGTTSSPRTLGLSPVLPLPKDPYPIPYPALSSLWGSFPQSYSLPTWGSKGQTEHLGLKGRQPNEIQALSDFKTPRKPKHSIYVSYYRKLAWGKQHSSFSEGLKLDLHHPKKRSLLSNQGMSCPGRRWSLTLWPISVKTTCRM